MMDTPVPTSPRRILIATGVALATALILLIVAVLPAEYGIDPLGTGKALGKSGSIPACQSLQCATLGDQPRLRHSAIAAWPKNKNRRCSS